MARTLSTAAVARHMGVAVNSVINWIDQGLLPAGRTPGGHRRVLPTDLARFLVRQGLPVPPQLGRPPATVLVVDDESGCTEWLACEFAERYSDCRVLVANDGFCAGKLFGVHRPDLVVLDLRMPGMDGFEVCRNIKQETDVEDTAIIAVTAYPSPNAEREIIECGADAYLIKPLEAEELFAVAEACLGRRLSRALTTAT